MRWRTTPKPEEVTTSYKNLRLLQRADGYAYTTQKEEGVSPRPEGRGTHPKKQMTDHSPADGTPLMAALEALDLPDRFLKNLAADPENAGELLMEFVADLDGVGRGDQARRVLGAVREHAPAPEDRQYASVELAKLLREGRGTKDVAEAERITDELLRPGVLKEGPAQLLGEDLQELDRWEEALHCYNVSARQLLTEPPKELEDVDDLSLMPLVSRLLARMNVGLARDEHDEVALGVAQRQVEGLSEFLGGQGGDPLEGVDPEQGVETLYSREAFDDARTRGLLTAESAEHGADAYYRAAERGLREWARKHPETRWNVLLHGVQEIVEFAERSGLDPAAGDTASNWVDQELTADDPRLHPWPPGRNEACWCASGRKYKKCCGSPSNR